MSWLLQSLISTFLIALSIGQFASTLGGLRGASLVGANRWAGLGLSLALFLGGFWLLPSSLYVLAWVPLTALLAFVLLLVAGSLIAPPVHPDALYKPDHPAHGGCQPVKIWDGIDEAPGYLLTPPAEKAGSEAGAAVCLVHGAGDHKTFFKWRLIQTLLAEGLTVLTIDLPGHGDYRHRLLVYPDCVSPIPAAVKFLREQPGVSRVGLVGISLGGAMALQAAAQYFLAHQRHLVEALVVVETPTHLAFNRSLFYQEAWNTFHGSPVLSLLRETTLKQVRESWLSGGYRGRHGVAELFTLLNPLEQVRHLKQIPILFVYSRRDRIAPPDQAEAMRQAAPHAQFIESKKASHVVLTLLQDINQQIAGWLEKQLKLTHEPELTFPEADK
jgi:pimeloyl-ACP methyl ester carboxylesterase